MLHRVLYPFSGVLEGLMVVEVSESVGVSDRCFTNSTAIARA